jgi:hypothetical protein
MGPTPFEPIWSRYAPVMADNTLPPPQINVPMILPASPRELSDVVPRVTSFALRVHFDGSTYDDGADPVTDRLPLGWYANLRAWASVITMGPYPTRADAVCALRAYRRERHPGKSAGVEAR